MIWMQPMVSKLFLIGTQIMLFVTKPDSSSTLREKRSSFEVSSTMTDLPSLTTEPAMPCPFSIVMPLMSTGPWLKMGKRRSLFLSSTQIDPASQPSVLMMISRQDESALSRTSSSWSTCVICQIVWLKRVFLSVMFFLLR